MDQLFIFAGMVVLGVIMSGVGNVSVPAAPVGGGRASAVG